MNYTQRALLKTHETATSLSYASMTPKESQAGAMFCSSSFENLKVFIAMWSFGVGCK
jgi:hypothetical protein